MMDVFFARLRLVRRVSGLALVLLSALAAGTAQLGAQTAPGQPRPVPAGNMAQGGGPAATAATQQATEALSRRIDHLEARLTDLQGAIGAFQSLAGGQVMAGVPGGGGDDGAGGVSERVDVLETQIQALSGQIQQLTEAIASLQGRNGGPGRATGGAGAMAAPAASGGGGLWQPQVAPQAPGRWPQAREARGPVEGAAGAGGRRVAALSSDPAAKAAFEAAHGFIIRQDYQGAEQAFRAFLRRFPRDPLAGSAQYWLGESYYLRGRYKQAAASFLAGVRNHKGGMRGPDTMMRLGMSLARLGQNKAACRTFAQLKQTYPGMGAHIRRQAGNEARRLGC